MFKHFGFLVEKLKRVKIGFLELGALKPGAYRTLTELGGGAIRKAAGTGTRRRTRSMTDQQIAELLSSTKTIAVVGLSSNPMRPSFGVSRFLQRQGYRIIPVNPNETEVLGETIVSFLAEVPGGSTS